MRTGHKDLVGGILIALVGALFLAGASKMRLGDALEMGPGYFPVLAAGLVIVLGIVIAVLGLFRSGAIGTPDWRPAAASLGCILVFGLLLEQVGLVPAIAVGIAVAALGDPASRPRETVFLAFGTAFLGWLVFRVALGLQMPGLRMPAFLG